MLIKTSLFLHTDGHFIDVDPGGVGDTGGDVDFGEVELVSMMGEEYNITSAMSDFSVVLARKPYTRDINS